MSVPFDFDQLAWIVWGKAHLDSSRIPSPGMIDGKVAVFLDKDEAQREADNAAPAEIIENTIGTFLGLSPNAYSTHRLSHVRCIGIVLIRNGEVIHSLSAEGQSQSGSERENDAEKEDLGEKRPGG